MVETQGKQMIWALLGLPVAVSVAYLMRHESLAVMFVTSLVAWFVWPMVMMVGVVSWLAR